MLNSKSIHTLSKNSKHSSIFDIGTADIVQMDIIVLYMKKCLMLLAALPCNRGEHLHTCEELGRTLISVPILFLQLSSVPSSSLVFWKVIRYE